MKDNVILNKLLVCAYVIIALLTINTFVLIVSNVDTKKSTSSSNTEEKLGENEEYDVSMMNAVNVDKVLKLYESKSAQVIYLGRSTCGYCVKFLPALQKAQKEYGYKTNYLDITTVSEEDQAKLLKKDNDEGFLAKNYGATPMVLVVKNGKLVDTWIGYSEYDSFAKFIEDNGFKK